MTEVVMSQTPPALHDGPTEKERKYDRQLRLWAASGQAALESAHIVLVNSGSGTVGTEALKNLVLPGIGAFTIIDDQVVTEADLGVNFFLDPSCLGKSRAESCAELLLGLNSEVQGSWLPEPGVARNIGNLLRSISTPTIILYTLPISPDDLQEIQAFAKEHLTPALSIHSAGFYSYFHVDLPSSFPIVETHPDEVKTLDLRLLSPWPELSEFASGMTKHIDKLGTDDHGHLPYVVILLHYLEVWKQSHQGKFPLRSPDKAAFQKMVQNAIRTDTPEAGEENFEEAVNIIKRVIVEPSLPATLKEVFDHVPTGPYETQSGFWVIASAMRKFYEKHKCLPVPGNLPDMKARSEDYVKLQTIYKNKARKDASEVLGLVRELPFGENIEPSEVDIFCKNAAFVKLIKASGSDSDGSVLKKTAERILEEDKVMAESSMPQSSLPIYLALKATSHNISSPASKEEILEAISRIVPDARDNERLAQTAEEVSRTQGGEIHNTSAVTGGIVAQEMIKIITKQYIPVDNTCVFDGILSRCYIFQS